MPVVDKRNESGDSQDEDDSDDSHKGPRLALYWRALRVIWEGCKERSVWDLVLVGRLFRGPSIMTSVVGMV